MGSYSVHFKKSSSEQFKESYKGNTLRIKLYRTILYNFNCKIYIRDFAQHLRKIRKKYDRRSKRVL